MRRAGREGSQSAAAQRTRSRREAPLQGSQYTTDLRAYGEAGELLWSTQVGLPSECPSENWVAPPGTWVDGVAIDAHGNVIVGCDTCVGGVSGVATLDGATGDLVRFVELPRHLFNVDDEARSYAG